MRARTAYLVACLVACLAALAASTAGAAAPSRPSGLPDCLGKPKVRPSTVIFACADANFGIRHLHWIGWGEPSAAAVGVVYANDCTPSCAAGHFHDYRGVIVASGSQRCGTAVDYLRVMIAFVGPTPYPKAKPADLTYPFRCR